MRVMILVHSQTGNTRKFADSILNKLSTDGHTVNLVQLETTVPLKGGSVRQNMDISFNNLPDVSEVDYILLGGPVWAFGPSPVIVAALQKLGNLKGKTVLSFITMGFPLKGMGGKGALNWMNRVAATLGAKVLPGSICCQMFHNLEQQIVSETEHIATLIK